MTGHIQGPLSHIALGPLNAPRMVFVHPNPMDSSTWLYQMAHFSTWYRCISVDLPGYGWSGTATAGVTMREVAEAVWAAADTAGGDPDSPVILVGCSIGSHIVEYMYWVRPESTAAIVLSGTGWQGEPRTNFAKRAVEYREQGVGYRVTHAYEDLSPEFRENPLATWYADLIAERAGTADAETIAAMFDSRVAIDPDEFYTDLKAPVLILKGSLDGELQRAYDLAELLPDSKLILVEGAGHACYYEQPLVFDHHMLDFLRDRLPEELRPTPELAARFGAPSVTNA